MEDSLRPEVLALLDGGALRTGLGCDGAGGVGPTRVWYLLRVGASEEEPTTGLPWVVAVVNKVAAVAGAAGTTAVAAARAAEGTAVAAAVAGGAAAITAVAGGTAERGGEELRTLGQKACPPRVFTMVGLDEERR